MVLIDEGRKKRSDSLNYGGEHERRNEGAERKEVNNVWKKKKHTGRRGGKKHPLQEHLGENQERKVPARRKNEKLGRQDSTDCRWKGEARNGEKAEATDCVAVGTLPEPSKAHGKRDTKEGGPLGQGFF